MNRDDWVAFIGAVAFALALVAATTAFAADPKLPAGIDCDFVRSAVAEHGRIKAMRWARENGYTWAQIAEARRCLR